MRGTEVYRSILRHRKYYVGKKIKFYSNQPNPKKPNGDVYLSHQLFFYGVGENVTSSLLRQEARNLQDTIVIKDYHFPRFHKRLPISNIEGVQVVEKLTFRTGKYRLWGSQWFGVWLPFHWRRDWRQEALIIRQKKCWIKNIIVTLDSEDPAKACQILQKLQGS